MVHLWIYIERKYFDFADDFNWPCKWIVYWSNYDETNVLVIQIFHYVHCFWNSAFLVAFNFCDFKTRTKTIPYFEFWLTCSSRIFHDNESEYFACKVVNFKIFCSYRSFVAMSSPHFASHSLCYKPLSSFPHQWERLSSELLRDSGR